MTKYKIFMMSSCILDIELSMPIRDFISGIEKCRRKNCLYEMTYTDGRSKFINPNHIIVIEQK